MSKIEIVSGFLGAGKTTLIKKLLKEAYSQEQIVLIENEFGEIGIDGGFLQEAGIEIREMNSGCICCSLVGDFSEALKKVQEQYHPDRIIIEPSGVGKLSDVIKAVQSVQEETMHLNCFATVVDATKCKMYMKNFGEFFENQVEYAQTILLSRTEKLEQDQLQEVVDLLRKCNPNASIITTPWDQLQGLEIVKVMEQNHSLEKELMEECNCGHHHDHHEGECNCGHRHDHHEGECNCGHPHDHHEGECECGHPHDHHHADEVFVSWGQETVRCFDREELKAMLQQLDQKESYGTVLRAKGILASQENTWLYFDYVPGEIEIRTGEPSYTGRLCVIGTQLNEEALTTLFRLNQVK